MEETSKPAPLQKNRKDAAPDLSALGLGATGPNEAPFLILTPGHPSRHLIGPPSGPVQSAQIPDTMKDVGW